MPDRAPKRNRPDVKQSSDIRQSKVLIVGGDSLLPGHASRHFFFGNQRARIADRTEKLSEALPRLKSTVIDIVLTGGDFTPEELLLFAIDAKQCGYTGVILQAGAPFSEGGESASPSKRRPLHAGDFVIDIDRHRAWVRGAEIYFTPREFALLVYFANHPRELLTHETLREVFWGDPTAPIEPLRVLIQTLRAKIEMGAPPRYIVTQHHLGYRFNPTAYPLP